MRSLLVTEQRPRFGLSALFVLAIMVQHAPAMAQQAQSKEDYRRQQRELVNKTRRINDVLLTNKMVNAFNAIETDYKRLVGRGTTGRNQKEMGLLKTGLQYRILILADLDFQGGEAFPVLFNNVKNDLRKAGNSAGSASEKTAFRKLYYDVAWPYLMQLMKHNLDSRFAAMRLMNFCEVDTGRNNGRLRMYEKVPNFYIDILKSTDQTDAVKALACTKIIELIKKADPSERIQMEYAAAAASMLRNPNISDPFAISLLQMMEHITAPRAVVGAKIPTVVCAAVDVMCDSNRDIQVRCRAARTAGRTGFDSSLDYDPIGWRCGELAIELATAYNSTDKQKLPQDSDYWKLSAWYLHTAFRHEDRSDLRANPGFTNRAPKSEMIKGASAEVSKVVLDIMLAKDVSRNTRQALFKWTQENKPKDLKYDGGCPPIKPIF